MQHRTSSYRFMPDCAVSLSVVLRLAEVFDDQCHLILVVVVAGAVQPDTAELLHQLRAAVDLAAQVVQRHLRLAGVGEIPAGQLLL